MGICGGCQKVESYDSMLEEKSVMIKELFLPLFKRDNIDEISSFASKESGYRGRGEFRI